MKSLLLLKHIKVENANAITGLTWGFPGISHFLGFTHLLSRYVERKHSQSLGGCAVICHHSQVQSHPKEYGEHIFALTRNPLNKEGKTAAFNEEGRMHMEISLIIECDFRLSQLDMDGDSSEDDLRLFQNDIREQLLKQRIAGGLIQNVQSVEFISLQEKIEEREWQLRRVMMQSLPGFLLVNRADLLADHHAKVKEHRPKTQWIDSWLDFATITYEPELEEGVLPDENSDVTWIKKKGVAAKGWFVPISIGYKAISPLYEPGRVAHARSEEYPFRFVESLYSVGEWVSPHRIPVDDVSRIFWRYVHEDEWYLCKNSYRITEKNSVHLKQGI